MLVCQRAVNSNLSPESAVQLRRGCGDRAMPICQILIWFPLVISWPSLLREQALILRDTASICEMRGLSFKHCTSMHYAGRLVTLTPLYNCCVAILFFSHYLSYCMPSIEPRADGSWMWNSPIIWFLSSLGESQGGWPCYDLNGAFVYHGQLFVPTRSLMIQQSTYYEMQLFGQKLRQYQNNGKRMICSKRITSDFKHDRLELSIQKLTVEQWSDSYQKYQIHPWGILDKTLCSHLVQTYETDLKALTF